MNDLSKKQFQQFIERLPPALSNDRNKQTLLKSWMSINWSEIIDKKINLKKHTTPTNYNKFIQIRKLISKYFNEFKTHNDIINEWSSLTHNQKINWKSSMFLNFENIKNNYLKELTEIIVNYTKNINTKLNINKVNVNIDDDYEINIQSLVNCLASAYLNMIMVNLDKTISKIHLDDTEINFIISLINKELELDTININDNDNDNDNNNDNYINLSSIINAELDKIHYTF
jgi:hypothetical protein